MKLKEHLKKKLSEMINPIGQSYTVDQISSELMIIINEYDGSNFIPPDINEIITYITEKKLLDQKSISTIKKSGEMFLDYYSSRGWKIGKHKMKNWKKALNNWCKRDWVLDNKKSKIEDAVQAHMLIQNLKK